MSTIIIIGAGAGGMMAALTAAENRLNRVLLLERQARVGRKLLATGNGRCNLTNLHAELPHYHGEDAQFAQHALEAFGAEAALAWFRAHGLLTAAEPSGRVYPLSNSANSVLDVLRLALAEQDNIDLRTGVCVTALRRAQNGFSVDPDLTDRIERIDIQPNSFLLEEFLRNIKFAAPGPVVIPNPLYLVFIESDIGIGQNSRIDQCGTVFSGNLCGNGFEIRFIAR